MADGARQPHMALTRRYSCMYTPDVAKKGKVWHDGYLLFHHMNSKMLLVDEKFAELDDCFFRIPGIQSLSDVPKSVVLTEGVQVDFDKHIATVEELVFEEEKDVSEMWTKKRKDLDALDSLADADEDEPDRRPPKRLQATYRDSPASRHLLQRSTTPMQGKVNHQSSVCPKPAPPLPFRSQLHLHQKDVNSPQRAVPGPSGLGAAVQQAARSSPNVSTPFKAPTFLHASSPLVSAGPSSLAKKRSLGTTRPSSIVAYESLQSDWAKFAETETVEKAAAKSSPWRERETEEQREARKKAMLEKLTKEKEVEIVPVNQERRDGQEGDPSGWMFDD